MQKVVRFLLLFFLIGLLLFRVPVYANNLIGDDGGEAIGSTAVTARVELPEDYEPDDPEDDGLVNTGDSAQIIPYGIAIMLCGTVIVKVLKVKQNMK